MFGVFEADEAPPAALDEDRHRKYGDRAGQFERFALIVGQVTDVAADDVAAAQNLGPAREVRSGLDVRETWVVNGRVGPARCPAGEPASVRGRAVALDVLEDIRARDAGCLAEDAHQLDDPFVEAWLYEEALGGPADGLKDRVPAA